MKLISILLVLLSSFLSLKHGWDAFQPGNAEQAEMMAGLGITQTVKPFFGVFSILIGLLILFPQTFFIGNLLNAITIVLIMALSLRTGIISTALLEIPFLALTLLLIWLTYPFKP
jgi:hypothetical protein